MVSSGASRSTRASWKWSRKLLQRSAATTRTKRIHSFLHYTVTTWSSPCNVCEGTYCTCYFWQISTVSKGHCTKNDLCSNVKQFNLHWGIIRIYPKLVSSFQQNVPMVFLPVHKSHIDYLLITLILFCHNIKAPHIAAGNNLSIPILRYEARFCSLCAWKHKDQFDIRRKGNSSGTDQRGIKGELKSETKDWTLIFTLREY